MGQPRKMRKQKGGEGSLDVIHNQSNVKSFVKDVRTITTKNDDEQLKAVATLKNTINNILNNKDSNKELSAVLNTYSNNLETRKQSDMKDASNELQVEECIKISLDEESKTKILQSELEAVISSKNLNVSAEEIKTLLLKPYIDKFNVQAGGGWKGSGSNSIIPGLLAGALCGGAVFLSFGVLGLAILGGFVAVQIGIVAAVVVTQDDDGQEGGDNDEFDKGQEIGQKTVEEKYPEHVNDVKDRAEKRTLIGKLVSSNPNQDTFDALERRLHPPAPAAAAPAAAPAEGGGKRRTRKAKKSKKRSAKKSKKNAKRKTKKSRR